MLQDDGNEAIDRMTIVRAAGVIAAAFVTTIAVSVAYAPDAHATDLPMYKGDPVAPAAIPPVYTWTGFFGGVDVGWISPHHSENGPSDGFVGGVHAGYNFQVDNFVYGPVASLTYSHRPSSVEGIAGAHFDSDWEGSLRLRGGVVFDRVFLYGTGGFEAARGTLDGTGWSDSHIHPGWTAGVGVEYMFHPNWTAGVEVRYSDFGSRTYHTPVGNTKVDWNEVKALGQLNYKF